MTLREYLTLHTITESAFARMIGTSQAAVSRYCSFRVPAAPQMRAIVNATQGAVSVVDFESFSSVPSQPVAQLPSLAVSAAP